MRLYPLTYPLHHCFTQSAPKNVASDNFDIEQAPLHAMLKATLASRNQSSTTSDAQDVSPNSYLLWNGVTTGREQSNTLEECCGPRSWPRAASSALI